MPGVLAAYGAVASDLTATRTRSVLRTLDETAYEAVREALDTVVEEARREVTSEDATITHALDLRYLGQSYELTVELDGALDLGRAAEDFHALHDRRFAHADRDAPLEVVNARATARVVSETSQPRPGPLADGGEPSTVEVWFDGERRDTAVYARDTLAAGARLEGPAIVTQLDTTTLVPPGWEGTVDGAGNLLLTPLRESGRRA